MPVANTVEMTAVSISYLPHISGCSRPGRRRSPEVYEFDHKRSEIEMGVLDPRPSHPNPDASLSLAICAKMQH